MVAIRIPGPFRRFTEDQAKVVVDATTVGEALAVLAKTHDGIVPHLFDKDGRLHDFVSVFLNQVDIRVLESDATPLGDGDELVLLPSIAGG